MITPVATLLLVVLLVDGLTSAHKSDAVKEKYEVVYPQKLHTQHKRDTESKYPDQVHYGLEVNGKPLVLQLEKTEDLFFNYSETHYLEDGTPVTTSPQEQEHCNYQGHVKNDNTSQVSLSVCNGLSGVIMTQEQKLLIEPLNMTENGAHAVYENQEQEVPKTCGVDDSMFNESVTTKVSFSTTNAEKKKFLEAKKYIELYIVADKSMFIKYNRNKTELQLRIFSIMNFVNMVYKPLNIFVALTGLEIWDSQDRFPVVTSANSNLDQFSKWRETKLLPRKPNDNAQFLTNIDFDGATVGLAWIKTLCSQTSSTGVVQDHSKNYIPVAATLAHEMGHNLGMDHDTNACYCWGGSCIMAASLSYNTPERFSACSHQHYQDFLLSSMPLCMKNRPKPKDMLNTPMCGNKFTEMGEECDCGTVEECTNKCCDAKTCKLKDNAQCAEGGCCSNCQLKKSGTVCRHAKDDCDLADMCDGKSSMCPTDRFRFKGFPCNNGKGHCYNGKCPTLQGQCEMYWGRGSYAAASYCFDMNRRGIGYCHQNGVNVHCQPEDVKCGVLFCSGGNSRPIDPQKGYYKVSTCNTVTPNELVEEGTRCGDNKTCQSGRCISIARALQQSASCSAGCPGHGVCDHEEQCQCEEGWAPPNCDYYVQSIGSGYTALIVIIVLVLIIVVVFLAWRFQFKNKSRKASPGTGVSNPTFNIQNQARQPQAYPSTPQMHSGKANYAPQPPAQSHKPQVFNMYPPPQPSAQPQKPFTSQEFQRPTTGPPPRPTYPSVPPKALKPNYRS